MADKRIQSMREKESRLTHDRLTSLVDYNPETGELIAKVRLGARRGAGERVGWKQNNGYLMMSIDGDKFLLHRLAWFYVHKYWPLEMIDHINRVRNDNRLENLREANASSNALNNGGKGYTYNKANKNWNAFMNVVVEGVRKKVHLGCFKSEQEASRAVLAAKEV